MADSAKVQSPITTLATLVINDERCWSDLCQYSVLP